MDRHENKDLPVRARIKIPPPNPTGRESMKITDAELGYGARAILTNVNLRLERGAHLGVVGVNGAGKSTLLKSIEGSLPLVRGERELGYQVSLSYFSQHSADQLKQNETVIQALQRTSPRDVDQQDILNMAGSLLFSGDDINKPVRVLSGGEKSRVALGQILLKRSPLLLLDEPTNHLDFDTVEALTEALREYQGTVVVVSHDRGFIGRIATRILEIRDGRVELYPGTYDEYVWSVQRGALSERAPGTGTNTAGDGVTTAAPALPVKKGRGGGGPSLKALQATQKEAQRKLFKAEEKLAKLIAERDRLNAELASAAGDLTKVAHDLADVTAQVDSLEEEMLGYLETIEETGRAIAGD